MKKNILVSVDRGETRVAVLEAKGSPNEGKRPKKAAPTKEWKVAELYVERRGRRSIVGNIYKGKVDNVLPGMEAAFVDIGLERNGFLHVDEIVLPDGKAVPKRGRGRGRRIDELIKPGQEIIVQVVKDPLKTKGARLSMQLSIAGRYLVYMPQGGGIGVSKRLPDGERTRLRKLIEKVDIGDGGVIVRTAAQGAKKEDFVREIAYLHRLNEVVSERAEKAEVGQMVFQEADLSIRVVRDVLVEEFEGAIIDDPKQHERVTKFLQRTAPELAERVELYKGKEPLLEKWGVEEAFDSVLSRRVDLPSGGYLMIDYAEALTVIDINTGQLHRQGQGPARGHDHQGQRRGRRGGRAPAADARHRRDHRHRLHRHGAGPQPRPGAEDAAHRARRGPDQDLRGRGLAARPGRDDAPERHRRRARDPHQALPDLRRRGRRRARRRRSRSRSSASCGEVVDEQPEAGGLPDPGQPAGGRRAALGRLGPHRPRGGDRQAVPLRGRRCAAARHLPRGRDRRPRGDRGAGAAIPGRRGGAGLDRGAAHVQRRRRRGAGRLLHRQRHRGGPPRRRAADGANRERRALRGDRGPAARQRGQRGAAGCQWKWRREARILGLQRAPPSRKQGRQATFPPAGQQTGPSRRNSRRNEPATQ